MPSCPPIHKLIASRRKRNSTPASTALLAPRDIPVPTTEKERLSEARPTTSASGKTSSSIRTRAREIRYSSGFGNGTKRDKGKALAGEKRVERFEDCGVYIMLYASEARDIERGKGQKSGDAIDFENSRRFSNSSSIYQEDLIAAANATAAAKAERDQYEWGIYLPIQIGQRRKPKRSHEQTKLKSRSRSSSMFSYLLGSRKGGSTESRTERKDRIPVQHVQPTPFGRLWRLARSNGIANNNRSSSRRPAMSHSQSTSSFSHTSTIPSFPAQKSHSSSLLVPPHPSSQMQVPLAGAAKTAPATGAKIITNNKKAKPAWRVKKLSSGSIPDDPNLLLACKIGYVMPEARKNFEMAVSAVPVSSSKHTLRAVRDDSSGQADDGITMTTASSICAGNGPCEFSLSGIWVEETLRRAIMCGHCMQEAVSAKQKEKDKDIDGVMRFMREIVEHRGDTRDERRAGPLIIKTNI